MEAKDGSVVDFNHVLEHVRNVNPTCEGAEELLPDDLQVGIVMKVNFFAL